MTKTKTLTDTAFLRVAKLRRAVESRRLLRWMSGRTATTIALGTALSLGGAAEALNDVHFLVRKDLDAVRVVKQDRGRTAVVAQINDGFAGNSVFKLSRVFPERFVTQQISLFTDAWLPNAGSSLQQSSRPAAFRAGFAKLSRINHAIRREFFTSAMPYGDIIHEKALKYDVDPALVAAVMETESRFKSRARSQVGAQGLMQLMPRTGAWMGATNLYDPEQNVDAGVKYLKYLQRRFNGDLTKAIAAYNAGEGNVLRYQGVPPFRETRSYVKKVFTKYNERARQLEQYDRDRATSGTTTEPVDGVVTLR